MTLAIKLDLHELEGEGLRVEQVVEITETGARPLNKLAMKVKTTGQFITPKSCISFFLICVCIINIYNYYI